MIIFYDRAIDEDTRQKVKNNLAAKYRTEEALQRELDEKLDRLVRSIGFAKKYVHKNKRALEEVIEDRLERFGFEPIKKEYGREWYYQLTDSEAVRIVTLEGFGCKAEEVNRVTRYWGDILGDEV